MKNKKRDNIISEKRGKLLLIGILLLISLLAVGSLVVVNASQDRITHLESEITNSGYSWLVSHNLQNGGGI
ncbi:MAG: hypothetical protein KKE50_00150 [Nanoarchaeota archaeon]|nr:hypothetical protein [Nanoarchaeota archaeon]